MDVEVDGAELEQDALITISDIPISNIFLIEHCFSRPNMVRSLILDVFRCSFLKSKLQWNQMN